MPDQGVPWQHTTVPLLVASKVLRHAQSSGTATAIQPHGPLHPRCCVPIPPTTVARPSPPLIAAAHMLRALRLPDLDVVHRPGRRVFCVRRIQTLNLQPALAAVLPNPTQHGEVGGNW